MHGHRLRFPQNEKRFFVAKFWIVFLTETWANTIKKETLSYKDSSCTKTADVLFIKIKTVNMESPQRASHPIITQTKNNTTLWIGHLQTDPTDHFAGQTFKCPDEGLIDNIQVYSSSVYDQGEIQLTLHEFDENTKTWGPSIGNSSLILKKDDAAKWIRFELQPVLLRKNLSYGFRLYANNGMIGIGEAAAGTQHPFTFGHEWSGDSANMQGHFFTYFSLAFKIEMRA